MRKTCVACGRGVRRGMRLCLSCAKGAEQAEVRARSASAKKKAVKKKSKPKKKAVKKKSKPKKKARK